MRFFPLSFSNSFIHCYCCSFDFYGFSIIRMTVKCQFTENWTQKEREKERKSANKSPTSCVLRLVCDHVFTFIQFLSLLLLSGDETIRTNGAVAAYKPWIIVYYEWRPGVGEQTQIKIKLVKLNRTDTVHWTHEIETETCGDVNFVQFNQSFGLIHEPVIISIWLSLSLLFNCFFFFCSSVTAMCHWALCKVQSTLHVEVNFILFESNDFTFGSTVDVCCQTIECTRAIIHLFIVIQ